MHACMHTYIHTYIHTCMHACMHACMHTYIHTYIYLYTYMYIDIMINMKKRRSGMRGGGQGGRRGREELNANYQVIVSLGPPLGKCVTHSATGTQTLVARVTKHCCASPANQCWAKVAACRKLFVWSKLLSGTGASKTVLMLHGARGNQHRGKWLKKRPRNACPLSGRHSQGGLTIISTIYIS